MFFFSLFTSNNARSHNMRPLSIREAPTTGRYGGLSTGSVYRTYVFRWQRPVGIWHWGSKTSSLGSDIWQLVVPHVRRLATGATPASSRIAAAARAWNAGAHSSHLLSIMHRSGPYGAM